MKNELQLLLRPFQAMYVNIRNWMKPFSWIAHELILKFEKKTLEKVIEYKSFTDFLSG